MEREKKGCLFGGFFFFCDVHEGWKGGQCLEQTGRSELGIITGNRLAIGQSPDHQATRPPGYKATPCSPISIGFQGGPEVTLILNGGEQIFKKIFKDSRK